MGLPLERFYNTTFKEFIYRLEGVNRRMAREDDRWRNMMAALINPHVKKPVKAKDILEIPIIDGDPKKPAISLDEQARVLEAWNKG